MSAIVIDGKKIADEILGELAAEVSVLRGKTGIQPCLAVIRVGDDKASEVYINNKIKACEKVGIYSIVDHRPTDQAHKALWSVSHFNNNQAVHGILVQLPLPPTLDRFKVFDAIDPRKDVDTFHPQNVGHLVQDRPLMKPCTPHGIQQLLIRTGIKTSGKRVVIVNRSLIVGQPLATMLIQDHYWANATVTICHDHTTNLGEITREADILVTAVGKYGDYVVTGDMVKPGAAVIDVAINRLPDGKLVGDCDDSVKTVAGWTTPVPGGVGPMTVAMLMFNTVQAYKNSLVK